MDMQKILEMAAALRAQSINAEDVQEVGNLMVSLGTDLANAPANEQASIAGIVTALWTLYGDVLIAIMTAYATYEAKIKHLDVPEELGEAWAETLENSNIIQKLTLD